MAKFPVVLFDLDGTLTDPKEGITRSIAYALTRMGRDVPQTNRLLFAIGPPLRASFATLLETSNPCEIERAMKLYRERFATIGLFENTVYPGVPEMLALMKSMEYKILLATAKPHVYAQKILDHFNLLVHFDGVYGSELDGRHQNKGDLLAHLLECERIDPANHAVIMIGDRVHDIDAAHANGCLAMGVTWGYGRELEHQNADLICESPVDISTALAKRFPRTD